MNGLPANPLEPPALADVLWLFFRSVPLLIGVLLLI